MKKIFFLCVFATLGMLLAIPASAQTQVTGTITDPNGLPYSFGTISATLIPASTGAWRCNGQPYTGQVPTTNIDANGIFAVSACPNASITPGGSQWVFSVSTPGVPPPLGFGSKSFTATLTISGATQDISAALSALAPALSRVTSGGAVSVGLVLPSIFNVTGSPVTGSGNLTGTFNVAGADYLVTSTAANTALFEQINGGSSCGDGTHAVNYNMTTHLFGCQALTTGTAGTVTNVGLVLPSIFNVTGSPVTVSGNLTGAFNVAGADYLVTSTAANTAIFEQINGGSSCGDGTHAVNYNTTTHLFGCQALTGGTSTLAGLSLTVTSLQTNQFICANSPTSWINCTAGVNVNPQSTTYTLASSDRGGLVKATNTVAVIHTLPLISGNFGASFYFTLGAYGTAAVTASPTAPNTFTVNGVTGLTSLQLNAGDTAYVASEASIWDVTVVNGDLPQLFAALQPCSAAMAGRTAMVTDSTTTTWGATITGTGTPATPYVTGKCNSVNWTVEGK